MWKLIAGGFLCYSMILFCLANEELPEKSKNDCNSNFTAPKSSITLTNHNLTNGSCVWFIEPHLPNGTVTKTITLFMHIVNLHKDDSVTLYSNKGDAENNTNAILEPIRTTNGSLTIATNEEMLVVKVAGNDTSFSRRLEFEYDANACGFSPSPDILILHSPIGAKNVSLSDCTYTFADIAYTRKIPSFVVEEFTYSNSKMTLGGTTYPDGDYNKDSQMDFFPSFVSDSNNKIMTIKVEHYFAYNESFRLRIQPVDRKCSGVKKVDQAGTQIWLSSPYDDWTNDSIVHECRWVIQNQPKGLLGFTLNNVHFDEVLDLAAVNDGGSERSRPLLQVTTSNINTTRNQFVRTAGDVMWVAFKSRTYASTFSANITVHGQGGYYKEKEDPAANNITMKNTDGNDTVFLLEVAENKVVLLNFSSSDFVFPATISVYDGFDTTNLLATLHGNVWYPVLSKSSKMMLVATSFHTGSWTASFKGIVGGCLHMSTYSNENYILSGNCNSTCLWVIPPQDHSGSELLLNLQFLALAEGDQLSILKLDAAKTHVGDVFANTTHVPQMSLPSNVGALVEVTRAPCEKENQDAVVVGHSSYIPACGGTLNLNALSTFRLTSPMHPDTYPVFSMCNWTLKTAKENLVHLAFNTMDLAPNHCLKITHSVDNITVYYVGHELQEDIFLYGDSVVEFNTVDCKKGKVADALVSSGGFVINGTVLDCGGRLISKPDGSFSVPPNKTLCMWKVSLPDTGDSSANDPVNIISYTVNKKDETGNYEFLVYDGNSVRDNVIVNDTKSEIWSRTNNLVFLYRRIDPNKPSSIIEVKYFTIGCNASMQCDNNICLHPDWRCDGKNDCGDYSDERNCASVPVPPKIEYTGYTATAFWITILAMLFLGGLLGVGIPYLYERYKPGYRRFGEISIIE